MPKQTKKKSPDTFKEAGNRAFISKNFEEAIEQYTIAIEMCSENPNHIYFANRANALLE